MILLFLQLLILDPCSLSLLNSFLLPCKHQQLAHIILHQGQQVQESLIPKLKFPLRHQILIKHLGAHVILQDEEAGVDEALQQVDGQALVRADLQVLAALLA